VQEHTEAEHPDTARLKRITAELLEKNHLFSILSEGQITKLIAMSSIRSYGPGEIIAVQQESGDSLFMLIDGQVSIIKANSSEQPTEVAKLLNGDICGEMTVFTDAPRSATIRSCSQSDILEIDRQAIAELVDEEPVLLERFSQLISERQETLNNLDALESQTPSARRDVLGRVKELFDTLLTTGKGHLPPG